MTNPGDWLRGLREELHLTRVAVERFTSEAASRANNERYRNSEDDGKTNLQARNKPEREEPTRGGSRHSDN
jgi:hypothetical protein